MADSLEGATLDEPLLERLYIELETPIFNVVYRWLWSRAEAEDVTQEAFMAVWKARERVDVATVRPLLYRTALNLASNRRRARRLWGWLGGDVPDDVPSRALTASRVLEIEETRVRVRTAIDALPSRLREVILLCEYSELGYAGIAEALGVPVGTVASRRNTALRHLATALGGIDEEIE